MNFDIETDRVSAPLREFLSKHNAVELLRRVKINREARVREKGNDESKPLTPGGSLGASFVWADTPEGHAFWNMIQLIVELEITESSAWKMRDLLVLVCNTIPAKPKPKPPMQPEETKKKRIITLPKT